jgi:hypothetical protein
MSRRGAAERFLAVLTAVVWLLMVAWLFAKAEPHLAKKWAVFVRSVFRQMRWLPVYMHLPAWAKEMAEVRGMAPGGDEPPLTVKDKPAWPTESPSDAPGE